MAAAAAAARRSRPLAKDQVHKGTENEPVSFHLAMILGNEYLLPSGKNSVDVLRLPFAAPHEGASNPSDLPFRFVQGKTSNVTGTRFDNF